MLGNSNLSTLGSGAIIITSPNPPVNLIENTDKKTKNIIGISWSPPLLDGGSVIIDYTVSMA